jgi:hypothetical protein
MQLTGLATAPDGFYHLNDYRATVPVALVLTALGSKRAEPPTAGIELLIRANRT